MLSTNASIKRHAREGLFDQAAGADLSPQTMVAGTAHDLGNLIQIASSSFNRLSRDPTVLTSEVLGPIVAAGALALGKAGGMLRRRIILSESHSQDPLTDVCDCIRELAVIFRSTWEPDHFSIDLRLEADLPHALCDRQDLQNALLNLVLNARDAMPDGGVIAVHVAALGRANDSMIELRVTDHGVGMTPDTMQRAFEPFFTTKGKGLGGVGLPMVKHFVETHGGRISLESVPTKGTIVTLQLPGAQHPTAAVRSYSDSGWLAGDGT